MKHKAGDKMRKSPKKNAAQPKPLRGKEKIAHYNAVLIEDLTSKFNFVIDRVIGLDEKFTNIFEGFSRKMQENDADIKLALKKIFSELDSNRRNWEENRQRWAENKKYWIENEARWVGNEKRWVENEARWVGNEKRWVENEARWAENKIEHQDMMAEIRKINKKVGEHDIILKKSAPEKFRLV